MSSAAFERQIRPVYDALDSGSNKSAVVACDKLLKKHPKNVLVKALKALALVRQQKIEESLALCDEVLATKPSEDAILTAMMHVLRGLGRYNDVIGMFEEAFKRVPANEEFGVQTFFANIRAGNWKSAQQVATKLHKQFQEERYLYWSVISAILQANDPSTPGTMRTILYKLAHRLIDSSPTPSYLNADRFYLHLLVVRELKLFEEADKLLNSEVGQKICSISLSCDELRRKIWKEQDLVENERTRATNLIKEKRDRNWLEFLAVLDATFAQSSEGSDPTSRVQESRELFEHVAKEDGPKDRSGPLALLELEKRAKESGVSSEPNRMNDLLEQYFDVVGDKACCFEDLKPYTILEGAQQERWTTFLKNVPATKKEAQKVINVHKLLRYGLAPSEVTVEAETELLKTYIQHYHEALPLGASLPATELQPADDFALLAGNTFTPEFVTRAFNSERYSQIPEFINFEQRLENSLQRDHVRIEHLRMRLAHEPISSDLIDMELIELKFLFDKIHYDNRDFDNFPDYQPKDAQSFNQQTLLFEKSEGLGWLSIFLKVYIRAFQQASDLDDTVEEKLLIGDRPKQTGDFDRSLSLRDRLVERTEDEFSELTDDEKKFEEFARALADWLEPYHNHARPPPSVVLAEAAKQTQLKTGHPLKGIEIPPSNGENASKKDEKPPAVTEAPEVVAKYFEGVKQRLEVVLKEEPLVDLLHVATLAQEAFLLFTVETTRFKSASVVKINKLGALVANFKPIREEAVSVLKHIAAELLTVANAQGPVEGRQSAANVSASVSSTQIEADFVNGVSKKIVDSRKKVVEGISKGISKIVSTYA
ncbi:hypothetical protein EST38_g4951 [Candolleomyces aberdarensis]|uniref:Uncharacterized protein n=1 Tax=Candolleomyces aberdarensis TaxID=2316362 RepID=A0A4Q2DNZ5_9AGAR|nr:hypothetical protein EST38_g4951 [Candolleomyces aberdarensis]